MGNQIKTHLGTPSTGTSGDTRHRLPFQSVAVGEKMFQSIGTIWVWNHLINVVCFWFFKGFTQKKRAPESHHNLLSFMSSQEKNVLSGGPRTQRSQTGDFIALQCLLLVTFWKVLSWFSRCLPRSLYLFRYILGKICSKTIHCFALQDFFYSNLWI